MDDGLNIQAGRRVPLALAMTCLGLLSACAGGGINNPRAIGKVGEGEGGDGLGGVSGDLLEIIPDSPVFLTEDGLAAVSGVVRTGEHTLRAVRVAGKEAEVEEGRFTALMPLESPFAVVEIEAEAIEGDLARVVVQAATAGEYPGLSLTGADQSRVGAEGLQALGAWMGRYLAPNALGPVEGSSLLNRSCVACEEGAECSWLDEQVVLTGAYSVELATQVEAESGRLLVDLAGSRVRYEAELRHNLGDGSPMLLSPMVVEASLREVATNAELDCGVSGVPVHQTNIEADFSVEGDSQLRCSIAEDLTEGFAPWWESQAPAALAEATCAWAEDVPERLAQELPGARRLVSARAEPGILRLDSELLLDAAPPHWSVVAPIDGVGTDLVVLLGPQVVGALLDLELRNWATTPRSASLRLDDQMFVAELQKVSEAGAVFAAGELGADSVMFPPIAVRIERDGATCMEGHLIPAPGALNARGSASGAVLAPDGLVVAGFDRVDTCGLGLGLSELASTLLEGADGGVTWAPAVGLMADGAAITAGTGRSTWTIEVPAP